MGDYEEAVEIFRLLAALPERWETRWANGLAGMLSPAEQLALPGVESVWVGSDATLDVLGAVDWDAKVYFRSPVAPFFGAFSEAAGDEEAEVIIAISELLGFAVMAASRWRDWRGKVVVYVGDNLNVITWLERRGPRNRFARHVIRVVTFLEVEGGFRLLPAYVRTYHNGALDYISRATREAVRSFAEILELTEMDGLPAFQELVKAGYVQRTLALQAVDAGAWQVAAQLRERRLHRSVPRMLEANALAGMVALEWRAGIGFYAAAWAAMGGEAYATPILREAKSGGRAWGPPIKMARESRPPAADVVLISLTNDPSGEEINRVVAVWNRTGAALLVADAPQSLGIPEPWRTGKGGEYRATWTTLSCMVLTRYLHHLPSLPRAKKSSSRLHWYNSTTLLNLPTRSG